MRAFSLMFALISLLMLAQLIIYVARGPVDPLIAALIFASFLICLVPALYLLKPFEGSEELKRRRERREERRAANEDPRGRGS
jgi:hypothetical protein